MNILFLYGNEKALTLAKWLQEKGHHIILHNKRINTSAIEENHIDLIVSFTYRFFIQNELVNAVNGNAVNLHISFLPWNKGADPNLWSFIDNTEKGVTIHYISDKIDGGDIIAQTKLSMTEDETLRSSYDLLMDAIILLFQNIFSEYPRWRTMALPQTCAGTLHFSSQLQTIKEALDFDIPIRHFIKELRIMAEKT